MITLLFLYIIVIISFSVYISRKGRFYVFSPFVTIYLTFATSDIIPLLMYESLSDLPSNILFVTASSTIVNLVMLFMFRKDFLIEMKMDFPESLFMYQNKRFVLIGIFIFILILAGLYTGVTTSILSGANVEDLRRTSEIGMGFVTAIPYFGVYLILLQFLFYKKRLNILQAGFISVLLGGVLFLTNAARAQILLGATVFFIWFNIKHRPFKWYEYFTLFYVLSPIVAVVLFVFRSGRGELDMADILFSHQNMIFLINTKNIMSYFEGSNSYLMGMSYWVPLTTIIPRFLWPDKPTSIDYYYKNLLGMDFEGGGIYSTPSMEMYINFGSYFIIFYILWLLLIHFLYKKALSNNIHQVHKVILLYFITLFFTPGNMISKFELLIVFVIICRFYYGKSKVV